MYCTHTYTHVLHAYIHTHFLKSHMFF